MRPPAVDVGAGRAVPDFLIAKVTTPADTASNRKLRFQTASMWWAHQDSNLEQAGYEPAALTVELWAPKSIANRKTLIANWNCAVSNACLQLAISNWHLAI